MNMPILYQNCIAQFATDEAQKYWLWVADNHDKSALKYKSDRLALEVDRIVKFIKPILIAAGGGRVDADDLMRFILKRHANWRLGGNVKMWWE